MTAITRRRTNGDVIAPFVDNAKASASAAVARFREHPDEAAVAVAPFVLLTLATMRHKLTLAEQMIVTECAFWGGVLAVQQYQQWKTQPAGIAQPRKAA